MAILTIQIRGTEKESKQTKQKFIAWKCKKKDGTWARLKFTKNVDEIPKKEGVYNMELDSKEMNKANDDFGEVWWVDAQDTNPKFTTFVRPDEAKDEF